MFRYAFAHEPAVAGALKAALVPAPAAAATFTAAAAAAALFGGARS